MIRLAALAILLAFGAPAPSGAEWPEWIRPWLYNSEERTRRAVEAVERGELAEAVELAEKALELDPESPTARYNTGTARLLSGDAGAATLLQSAAERTEDDALLSRVHYNLGNVKMAEDDLRGAVRSYKDALRHAPELEDAKYNLELALRLLEEEESEDSQSEEEEEQEEEQQEDQQESAPPPPPPPQETEDEEGEGDRPLSRFRDLPDMTAEEAAAILEAIENMEREQRREEAQKAARANVRGQKDW